MGKIKDALKGMFGKKENKGKKVSDMYSTQENGPEEEFDISKHPAIIARRQGVDKAAIAIAELERRQAEQEIQELMFREGQVETDKFGYRTTKTKDEITFEEAMATIQKLNKKPLIEYGNSESDSRDDEYDL
jgi:hypothetical protein